MYAVITPTFKPHFAFIKKYLQSFKKYLKDPQDVHIYFVVSSEEFLDIEETIRGYDELNITILCFEDILRHFGIEETPNSIMGKYEKFSFQTLKKLYTVLYIEERYSLILDSESMLVRETSVGELFDNYFQAPFISGSEIQGRFLSEFTHAVIQNIDDVLQTHVPFFFLENFVWFYDKSILHNLVEEYGSPIEIVRDVAERNTAQSFGRLVGIFEIELYHAYIWLNRGRYNYKFYNVSEIMRNALSDEQMTWYVRNHNRKFAGNCGLLERVMNMLNRSNINVLAQLVVSLNFNIIRCEQAYFKTYRLEKTFLKITRPNILAASQDHPFGINNKYVLLRHLFLRLKKHFAGFVAPFVWIATPFKILAKWVGELLITIVYVIEITIRFVQLMLWK